MSHECSCTLPVSKLPAADSSSGAGRAINIRLQDRRIVDKVAHVVGAYLWGGRGSNSVCACSRLLAVVQVVLEPASNACTYNRTSQHYTSKQSSTLSPGLSKV